MSFKDTLIGVCVAFLWGLNFVVIALGLNELPPFLLAASRFLLVGLIGSLFVKRPKIPFHWFVLYTLSISVAQFSFLFWAMDLGMTAGLASLILQSQVLFSAVLGVWLLNEKLQRSSIIGLTVSLLGLVGIGLSLTSTTTSLLSFGLTITAATGWALGNICNKVIANKGHTTGFGLVVWSAWLAVPPFMIMSLYFEGPVRIYEALSSISTTTVAAVMYLSLAATLVGFGFWSYLLSKYPASKVTPLSLAVPIFGMASAAIILDESITLYQSVGISLVLLGLVLHLWGKETLSRLSNLKIRNRHLR